MATALVVVAASPAALGQNSNQRSVAVAPSASVTHWGLSVVPDTCVTLQQGSECFQPLTVRWQAPVQGDYCVHISGEPKPLQCWERADSGQYLFEFRSSQSRTMQLRRANTSDDLDDADIDVKWVYRQRRAGIRWRVF